MKAYFHGLTMDKLEDAYDHYLHCLCFDEIQNRLFDNDYLKNKGIEDLSDEEIEIATDILRQDIGTRIDEDIDWGLCAMYAIDDVIAKRTPKEEPKPKFTDAPDAYYNKVLGMYGLADGDAFKIKGIPHFYHFDGGDLLYTENLEDEIATMSDYTLAQFLFEFKKEDIELVKPEPKDLLNDTLKMIGLETNQFFRVNDYEFIGNNYYIDSFGDVYVVSGHPDKFPEEREPENDQVYEYLTLGRLLTQYEDKIVPWDIKETGYA